MRVNGRALLSADAALLLRFAVPDKLGGKLPRTVMVIAVETAFFQCARAIVRSALWDPAHHVDAKALPTPGQILAELSQQTVGGAAYDEERSEEHTSELQ